MDGEEITFTEDELIKALVNALDLSADGEGYLTRRELERATGLSERVVNKRLDELFEANRIECQWVPRVNRAGVPQKIAAYRLVE